MNPNEITENNKLIAEFMGLMSQSLSNDGQFPVFEDPYSGEYVESIELSYNESWDWLMPVVEKILTDPDIAYLCQGGEGDKYYEDLHDAVWSINIEEVYKAVVAFINWYNENA